MAEPASEPATGELRDRFPTLHFLQSFWIAIQFPQLLLASAAVLVLALGQFAIDEALSPPPGSVSTLPWETPAIPTGAAEWSSGGAASGFSQLLLAPYLSVAEPAAGLLSLGNDWTSAAYYWTQLLWALVVWAFFGAAIARVAAIKFAVDQTLSMKSAARFGLKRYGAFLAAPLIPIAGVLFLWLVGTVGGWMGSIPAAGPYLIAVFWFAALGLGLLTALLLLGIGFGWPLMYAGIAAEDSESYDGFSRAFSYVYGRPAQGLRLVISALVYGVVVVGGVVLLALAAAYLAVWGASSGMGMTDTSELTENSAFFQIVVPHPNGAPQNEGDSGNQEDPAGNKEDPAGNKEGEQKKSEREPVPETARGITAFWLNAAALLVHGFAVSLFWTLSTIAYFVMRRVDDGTALDEVFLDEEDHPDALLPLIGVAASQQPAIERPLEKDPGEPPEAQDE